MLGGGMSQRALQMQHGGNSNLDDVALAESAQLGGNSINGD